MQASAGRVDTLPWVEKHRPSSVDDIVCAPHTHTHTHTHTPHHTTPHQQLSHAEIIDTITRLVDNGQMPHLLLYGPAGTGKTSTIMAIARRLYKENMRSNVLELNASDERGIDVVRNQIKEFASTRQLFGRDTGFKLVVLDEADQMTNEAQAALRRVIELYTRNVRFCIICNYVNKILPAIQSRCTRFRFGPLPRKLVVHKLREVATAEGAPFSDDALAAVFKLSGGDMRKGINILQGSAMAQAGGGEVGDEDVYAATGAPSPAVMRQIVDVTVNKNLAEAGAGVRALMQAKGLALTDVVRELHPWLMRLEGLKAQTRCWAVSALSDVEHQLCFSCNDKLQLGALLSIMQMVRLSVSEDKSVTEILVPSPMDD